MRREFAEGRLWVDRAIVLSSAGAAGLAVVSFTRFTQIADGWFGRVIAWHAWAALLWVPALTALVAWLMRRFAPGASGSGIPQVMAALDTRVTPADLPLFVSLRLALSKFVLTAGAVLAGLSVGREGPSVQVAAGVMGFARRWLSPRSGITTHGLLVAGGAAGIAAAFNTPLGGIVFAIEELSRTLEQRNSGLITTSIVLGGLVAVSVFGNNTYFGVLKVQHLGWHVFWPGVLVVVCAGLSGGLFSRLVATSMTPSNHWLDRARRRSPVLFAAGCGVAVAVIGLASGGLTYGGGYQHTRDLLDGIGSLPLLYVLLKFVSTWLATWTGVPGGIFAPCLAIGAGVGHDVALLTHSVNAIPLIALGMAGFLAAVTQAPLTSFIIVMEMVDGHAMVLSLMATTMTASLLSRMLSRPIYAVLSDLQLGRLPAQDAVADAGTGTGAEGRAHGPDSAGAEAAPAEPSAPPHHVG